MLHHEWNATTIRIAQKKIIIKRGQRKIAGKDPRYHKWALSAVVVTVDKKVNYLSQIQVSLKLKRRSSWQWIQICASSFVKNAHTYESKNSLRKLSILTYE